MEEHDGGTGACSTEHLASGAASPENTECQISNVKNNLPQRSQRTQRGGEGNGWAG